MCVCTRTIPGRSGAWRSRTHSQWNSSRHPFLPPPSRWRLAPLAVHSPGSRIADALEHAARAIGRLDALLTRHPLEPAWLWRIRLEAVRRQAAADGRAIDP
jgi:hypothetical protein